MESSTSLIDSNSLSLRFLNLYFTFSSRRQRKPNSSIHQFICTYSCSQDYSVIQGRVGNVPVFLSFQIKYYNSYKSTSSLKFIIHLLFFLFLNFWFFVAHSSILSIVNNYYAVGWWWQLLLLLFDQIRINQLINQV